MSELTSINGIENHWLRYNIEVANKASVMYRHFVRLTGVLLNIFIASFSMPLANPAHSQDLGFSDLNQSRQFFQEGRRSLEREIDKITRERDLKLPEIELPDNYLENKQQDLDNSSLLNLSENRLISAFTLKEYQYVKYDGVGLLTK